MNIAYHKKRENEWLLLYCLILKTIEPFEELITRKEDVVVLLRESLSEWGCTDVGSYISDNALIAKFDAPVLFDIPGFINAFKTRVGRLYKSGKRGFWEPGYFITTMEDSERVPEEKYFVYKEENRA